MYKVFCSVLFVFALGAVAQAQVKTTLVNKKAIVKTQPSIHAAEMKGVKLRKGDEVLVYEYFEADFPFWSAKIGMNEFYIEDAALKQTASLLARKETSAADRRARKKFHAKMKNATAGR